MIKLSSSTQKATAMSSAEAEVYVATRALAKAKGSISLATAFGEDPRITAHINAHATIGSSHMLGLGKDRHIETAGL